MKPSNFATLIAAAFLFTKAPLASASASQDEVITLYDPNSVDAHEEPPVIIALNAQNSVLTKLLLENAVTANFDYKQIYGPFEQENLFHKVIMLIDDEDAAIELLGLLHSKWNGFVNSPSNISSKNKVKYVVEGRTVEYKITKRNKWTPLMYALALRKNKIAKYLVNDLGAEKSHEGLDGINTKEIIDIRCAAFKTSPPMDEASKTKYIDESRDAIMADLMKLLDSEFKY